MSKILRRPMFRGGMPVDSRGTGITSGLIDKPRVGLQQSFPGTAGDAEAALNAYRQNLNLSNLANTRFSAGMPFAYELTPINTTTNLSSQTPKADETEEEDTKVNVLDDLAYFAGDSDFDTPEGPPVPSDTVLANIPKFMGGIDRDEYNRRQKEKAEKAEVSSQQVDTGDLGVEEENVANLERGDKSAVTGNQPSNVEVSAQDLIRENAELFKELLGEANKEDIKKARISDVSDYLLKFFEGTQKEGATLGSAAADVAAFATSKPSATEKAREAIKKTDQTATALAINDYIAGKRSKEDIAKMMAGLKLKADYAKGSLGEAFADFRAKQGTLSATDMEIIIKSRVRGADTEIIPRGSGEYKPNPDGSDEGKFYIEEETKDVYQVVNGKKVKRF